MSEVSCPSCLKLLIHDTILSKIIYNNLSLIYHSVDEFCKLRIVLNILINLGFLQHFFGAKGFEFWIIPKCRP